MDEGGDGQKVNESQELSIGRQYGRRTLLQVHRISGFGAAARAPKGFEHGQRFVEVRLPSCDQGGIDWIGRNLDLTEVGNVGGVAGLADGGTGIDDRDGEVLARRNVLVPVVEFGGVGGQAACAESFDGGIGAAGGDEPPRDEGPDEEGEESENRAAS